MARKNMVIGSIILALSFSMGAILKPLTPCQRLDAKIKATESLCGGIAREYANRSCGEQTDDERLVKMCVSVIEPQVIAKCMDTAEATQTRKDFLNFCQE